MQWGGGGGGGRGGGKRSSTDQRYEGVWSNVIGVTTGWVSIFQIKALRNT